MLSAEGLKTWGSARGRIGHRLRLGLGHEPRRRRQRRHGVLADGRRRRAIPKHRALAHRGTARIAATRIGRATKMPAEPGVVGKAKATADGAEGQDQSQGRRTRTQHGSLPLSKNDRRVCKMWTENATAHRSSLTGCRSAAPKDMERDWSRLPRWAFVLGAIMRQRGGFGK
jgi:hypothetical protein